MFDKRCMDKNMEYAMDNKNMKMPYDNNMCMGMDMGYYPMQLDGITCPVVYECPIERVCHREICHHVPHVCPINTRVINHHIYRHTYTPQYTCCEENDKCDVYEGNCCNF